MIKFSEDKRFNALVFLSLFLFFMLIIIATHDIVLNIKYNKLVKDYNEKCQKTDILERYNSVELPNINATLQSHDYVHIRQNKPGNKYTDRTGSYSI